MEASELKEPPGKPGGSPGIFPAWEESAVFLLQFLDVITEQVGMGIQEGPPQLPTPASPIPIPAPVIHDHETRECHVDDPPLDPGWFVRHGSSVQTQPLCGRRGRKSTAVGIDTGMKTFHEHLADQHILNRLRLIETYFSFDPQAYNRLFSDELAKLSASSPEHRAAIERLRNFDWIGYIAQSVRNAGYRDQREVQERTHDLVARLLTGGLFKNYDEKKHGPLDKRFKRSVGNGVRNMVERDRNRQRFLPSIPIGDSEHGPVTAFGRVCHGLEHDLTPAIIDGFRKLMRQEIGDLGLAVFDARMDGQEMRSLVGREDLGRPGRFTIKRIVQDIKALARRHALALGEPGFLRDVERAMDREAATVEKRRAATAAKQSR